MTSVPRAIVRLLRLPVAHYVAVTTKSYLFQERLPSAGKRQATNSATTASASF